MLPQKRGRHVPSSPSTTTGGWIHLAAAPPTPPKPSAHQSSAPPAAAASPSPSPRHEHGQQQVDRLCYMPEPWSRHTTTQIPTAPLIPALSSPPHLLLALAAFCAFWFIKWAQAGASATRPDQHPAAKPAPDSGPQVSPAMRWASLQLQQQGWQEPETAAAAAPASTRQLEPTTISQLICCIRTPTAAPSSRSSSAAADAIRRAVQHYSSAPGAPSLTGLTVTYPTCALMVLEGDTSSICAVLRELLQPASSAPLTSSSSPSPLGLSPRDARAVSFNPEADIRQFSDWYEAHVNTPLNPKLPMDRSLARMGRQPGGVMSGLGMPGAGGGMPGMGAVGQGMPGRGGGMGMPGMGMGGRGGMAGGAAAAGMPPVKAVLSDSEFLEAAEAVALFVSLVSTKLEGLPGYSQREELLKGLAREFTLPEPQVITSLAATEAVPTLPHFLEQFDIEYVRYATLALSDDGQQLLEAAIAADDGLVRNGAAADRTGPEEEPAADPAAREVQRLRFLYHRHLTLQLQEAVRSSSLDSTRESPLAKYYPKPKP